MIVSRIPSWNLSLPAHLSSHWDNSWNCFMNWHWGIQAGRSGWACIWQLMMNVWILWRSLSGAALRGYFVPANTCWAFESVRLLGKCLIFPSHHWSQLVFQTYLFTLYYLLWVGAFNRELPIPCLIHPLPPRLMWLWKYNGRCVAFWVSFHCIFRPATVEDRPKSLNLSLVNEI